MKVFSLILISRAQTIYQVACTLIGKLLCKRPALYLEKMGKLKTKGNPPLTHGIYLQQNSWIISAFCFRNIMFIYTSFNSYV